MNMLREIAGGLLKMFVGDVWLTIGILTVVSLTAALMSSGVMPPPFGGVFLFLGSIAVLVASVVRCGRGHRKR